MGLRRARRAGRERAWLAIVSALADAVGGAGIERIAETPAFAGEDVVNRLLHDLRGLDEPVVLVIDDLHELRSARRCVCSSASWTGSRPRS